MVIPRSGQGQIWSVALATALLCLACSLRSETSDVELKAAYTLNFVKFTQWPGSAQAADSVRLRVCVAGRSSLGRVLEDSAGTRIAGRDLWVDYVRLPGDVSACQLLFVSELDPLRTRRILGALAPNPVLTISDIPGFAGKGGMIELLVVEKRLRFEINLAAVRAAGLRLDPKLLRLAVRVHGQAEKEAQ